MGIIVLLLAGCQKNGGGSKPSITEVTPVLSAYLAAQEAASGAGGVTLDQLSVTSVGDFNKDMGGWPVFAGSYAVTHHEGVTTTHLTWRTPGSNTAAAFARRTGNGAIECFTPEVFQKAQKDINSAMQKAIDNIKIK
jgi:hypothetical protein